MEIRRAWVGAVVLASVVSGCDSCSMGRLLSADDGTCSLVSERLRGGDARIVHCGAPSNGNAGSTSGQFTELEVVYGASSDEPVMRGTLATYGDAASLTGGDERRWTCVSYGRHWPYLHLLEKKKDARNEATARAICDAFAKLESQ